MCFFRNPRVQKLDATEKNGAQFWIRLPKTLVLKQLGLIFILSFLLRDNSNYDILLFVEKE